MADKKIIAVVGATGSQGGGLVDAILDDSDGDFGVRALTRDPGSDKAQALAARGADLAEADLDDVESLEAAFAGAYGAYCMTNFWEHFSAEREKAQAGNLAEAAKSAGLQHVIWSTFTDTRKFLPISDDRMPVLQEKYNIPHFDAKGEANSYFIDRGVPTPFPVTSFYWDNLIPFGAGPQRGEDGVLAMTMPMGDKPLSGIASEDIGRIAYGIFKAGDEYSGRTVGAVGEHTTGAEMAKALTDALGEEVRYQEVPADVYRSFGFDGADEMGNMYQFKRDFNDVYVAERDIDEARRLNPELQTLRQWLVGNAGSIPID